MSKLLGKFSLIALSCIFTVSLGLMNCGSGGNQDNETKSSEEFTPVKLTRGMMEKYLVIHENLISETKDFVAQANELDEEKVMDRYKAFKYAKNWSQQTRDIIKEQGLTEDEFSNIGQTISEISAVLIKKQMHQEMEKMGGFSKFSDSGSDALKSALDNPMLNAEQKEEIKQQITEMEKTKQEMEKDRKEADVSLDKFDPENVKLVEEYLDRLIAPMM